jgi:hypothetical protein
LCCHRCGEEAPKGTRKKQQAAKKYDGGPSNATQADLDRELQMVEKQKAELNNKISKGKGAKVNEETDEPKPKRKRWADPLDDDNEEEDDEGDVDMDEGEPEDNSDNRKDNNMVDLCAQVDIPFVVFLFVVVVERVGPPLALRLRFVRFLVDLRSFAFADLVIELRFLLLNHLELSVEIGLCCVRGSAVILLRRLLFLPRALRCLFPASVTTQTRTPKIL